MIQIEQANSNKTNDEEKKINEYKKVMTKLYPLSSLYIGNWRMPLDEEPILLSNDFDQRSGKAVFELDF